MRYADREAAAFQSGFGTSRPASPTAPEKSPPPDPTLNWLDSPHRDSLQKRLHEERKRALRLSSGNLSGNEIIPTLQVLQNFHHVEPWDPPQAKRQVYKDQLAERELRRQQLKATWEMYFSYEQLGWMKALDLRNGIKELEPKVEEETVLDALNYFYPQRKDLEVYVLDFKLDGCETTRIRLAEIETYFHDKPDDVDVRWIHAPLGIGLLHSTVEDLFLGARKDPVSKFGPHHAWPYVDGWTETMNFRARKDIEDMRDAYGIIREIQRRDKDLASRLNETAWEGFTETMRVDLDWRRAHLGLEKDFWTLNGPDLPMQFSEGLALRHEPKDRITPLSREPEDLCLSAHPMFRNVQLVRDAFRAFHRPDGYLLTLSSYAGVGFIDKNLEAFTGFPSRSIKDNYDASALGVLFKLFEKTGSQTWHRRTVDWLLVYVLTEVAVTPHNIRQGRSAISLMSAYQSVVQNLKHMKYDPFDRSQTVELSRKYLKCIDELTTLTEILRIKVAGLETLESAVLQYDQITPQSPPDNANGESASSRLTWALTILRESHELGTRLLQEARVSMDTFFQLRTVEENEINVPSDHHNRAILLFTAIASVFLPLSFFTSYFGMNVEGIRSTNRDEVYFWKVCGSTTLALVVTVFLYTFGYKLKNPFAEVRQRRK